MQYLIILIKKSVIGLKNSNIKFKLIMKVRNHENYS